MLLKLSLTGIKSRLKDYIVLFSGLVMSAAIFYMFQSLATNKSFLSDSSTINSTFTLIIFQFGSILLGIITLAYIVYANSFLMQMRKRDYGMYMMLGAKKRKIGQLIFIETLVIGLLATIVGGALGVGLTKIVGGLLLKQMNTTSPHFTPFYLPAVIVTLVFFVILFILAAIFNQYSLLKTPILSLLNDDKQPNRVKQNKVWFALQVILGVIFLAIGYLQMRDIITVFPVSLGVALLTIILGTYFLFNAFFVWLINLLKKNTRFAFKGINNFTLGQLSFRIKDFTKMLSMVTILFALALGAITVGLGFQRQVKQLTDSSMPYDAILHDPSAKAKRLIEQINDKDLVVYHIKKDDKSFYVNADELNKNPLLIPDTSNMTSDVITKNIKVTAAKLNTDDMTVRSGLLGYLGLTADSSSIDGTKALSAAEFNASTLPEHVVWTVRNADFYGQLSLFEKLTAEESKTNHLSDGSDGNSDIANKYSIYSMGNMLYSGMEFMGFFLGIAFLAMLASCLMFKILSGAANDVKRYDMLNKIGVRHSLLTSSIRKEVFVLFALPGLVGVMHVLFGLQMFTKLMVSPYAGIWIPFIIFLALYSIYYFLTVWLYQGIVLKNTKKQ